MKSRTHIHILAVLAALLFCPFYGHAASVPMTWNASTTSGVTYNIRRAPCTGTITNSVCSSDATAVFTQIGAVGQGVTAYTDDQAVGNTSYIYAIRSACGAGSSCPAGFAGESIDSPHRAVVIPASQPAPPTNLVIGTVTASIDRHNHETLSANWTDDERKTTFVLSGTNDGNTTILKSGTKNSEKTGMFSLDWKGKMYDTLRLKICDPGGCVEQTVLTL